MVYFRLCHRFVYPLQKFFKSDYLGYFVWGFQASSKVHGSYDWEDAKPLDRIERLQHGSWLKLSPEFLCKLILSWKIRSAFKGRWLSELFDVITLSLLTKKSIMQHLLPVTCDHKGKICNWNEPNLSFLIMLAPYRQSIIF